MKGRVLIIAGSDSGGGAGLQADIKTVTALGGFAMTAVTALTVQDTKAVHEVIPVEPDIIRRQIETVLADLGADAVKIGMIGTVAAGRAILEGLEGFSGPIVLDPVLVATSGDRLGDDSVARWLADQMLPRATVVTPNVPELAALSGKLVGTEAEMVTAAHALAGHAGAAVLAKGGHLETEEIVDLLVTEGGEPVAIRHERLASRHTHGTGCTLASAVATGLAQRLDLEAACRRAVDYVTAAIRHAPGFGGGHGPLNHALRAGAQGFVPIDP
jgi:hydroxymethylpyrimidine/phosphomethylpyrimidine kinase